MKMIEFKFLNGAIISERDKNGNWVYKSNTENQLKPFKMNDNLKSEYADLPRFKILFQIEKIELNTFNSIVSDGVKDIVSRIILFNK